MALVESVSGVRGIYGKDLNEEAALKYTSSYLQFLKNKIKNKTPKIVIGIDTRPSSIFLKNKIIGGLNCEIIDLGIASTPATQLAVRHHKADGGIIITASHNEPEWNGFKFLRDDGGVLNEKEMNFVISDYRSDKFWHNKKINNQTIKKDNRIISKYTDFVFDITGRVNIKNIKNQKIKIVIDPNGGTGFIAKDILEKAGVEIIAVNTKAGEFKRKIEPNAESLHYLKDIIEKNNADFAVGFDCDADRAEIVLGDGTIVSGHYLLALASFYFLSKFNNGLNNNEKYNNVKNVVVNDATSYVVRDIVEKLGGKIIETGVGEANVVQEMYMQNALLGGEGSSSGVIVPPSRCRDGILSLLVILSLMANENKTVGDLISILPQYVTLSKKIKYKESNLEKIKKGITNYYSKKGFGIVTNHGSIKVITSQHSFVWFRESKTESGILRVIADSQNRAFSSALIKEGGEILADFIL